MVFQQIIHVINLYITKEIDLWCFWLAPILKLLECHWSICKKIAQGALVKVITLQMTYYYQFVPFK